MNEPLVHFRDASLGYGKIPVLSNVELAVHQGDFWGVLGHNGSGKSTVLKTLLGLLSPLKGRVLCRGGLRFGYVPQKEKLDPIYPLSAYEVAAMGTCRRWELGRSGSRELIDRCLGQSGALELAGRRYSDLSGGQRQRVLIARALAAEPEFLVLDEPLAGVDVTTQTALLKLLRSLKEQNNLTTFMVSHRIQREKGLFTHVAWVSEGKVETGPAEEMLSESKIMRVFETEL